MCNTVIDIANLPRWISQKFYSKTIMNDVIVKSIKDCISAAKQVTTTANKVNILKSSDH